MKFFQKATLVGSASGICALRLGLYYKLAHGGLLVLFYLYTMPGLNGRPYTKFPFFFDCLAPSFAMAVFNGMVGFRERSSGSIAITSVWMAVMLTAVHPVYLALWGAPPFDKPWLLERQELYFFTAFPSCAYIFIISLAFWGFRRHLAGIPCPD